MTENTIPVTGATGTLGRPLVELLVAEGAAVRAVSRAPHGARLPAEAEVVEGDPSRPGTLARHLDGVTAVFLHSRAIGESAGELLALARERGAGRVVALSATNIDEPLDRQPSRYRGDRNKESEAAAVASGLSWTSLRAGPFASNAVQAWAAQIRAGDTVRYVSASFREVPLDDRDLVEVAARALLTDELAGRRAELTGPQALAHEEMVAIIGAAIGRPLRLQEVPQEAFEQGMIRNGLPEPFVRALLDRYVRNVPEPVTDEVAKILGRPARTFAEWAADHARLFARGPDDND
ncbi:NAD(P)H-binding protein [Nonomuraea sp. NPDC050786]|uniref:NAD(P)H-binding protein n=1 Tax=Nonomuraea sp. NPDC050786 TaxID=3154840 RepID=UPI0033F97282